MSLIERKLTEFFDRCESVRPQIIGSKKNRRRTSPVNSPLIDRLIPEETGAVCIIQGVALNSKDRHAHCTWLYKRDTPEGSLYCVEGLDDERRVGDRLEQLYYVLSSLGLGGCEILPLEEELDKFTITDKTENSISYFIGTFLEYSLLTISNDSIKFNKGLYQITMLSVQ